MYFVFHLEFETRIKLQFDNVLVIFSIRGLTKQDMVALNFQPSHGMF